MKTRWLFEREVEIWNTIRWTGVQITRAKIFGKHGSR